jgi:hypothetical protein
VPHESATPALAALRQQFDDAWIEAELLHPVLAAFRRGGDAQPVWTINLASLATGSIEDVMNAVVKELVPKLRDIGRANFLLQKGKNALEPLSLPAVVALTRSNMFIPERSLRDGVVNDLARAAKTDSYMVLILSFALALITLIPSMGASLGIPIGAAGIALSAYSMAGEWEKYSKLTTLSNTDLDLARSLVTENPSLGSFLLSLAAAGFDLVPLVQAFRRLRRLRGLAAGGDDAVRASGKAPATKGLPRVPKGRVPVADTTNTLGEVVAHKSAQDLDLALSQAFNEKAKKLLEVIPKGRHGTEKVNPMMDDLLKSLKYEGRDPKYVGKTLTLEDLEHINLRHVVFTDLSGWNVPP